MPAESHTSSTRLGFPDDPKDALRREAGGFLDTVIENVPAAIFVQRANDGCLIFVNRAGEELFGVPRGDLIGKTNAEVYPAETANAVSEADRSLVQDRRPQLHRDVPFQTPANGTRIVNIQRRAVTATDGELLYLVSVIEDVTERKRAEKRIQHMAHHDPLTDLANRAAFTARLAQVQQACTVQRKKFAVLCMDLDHFKEVNDAFGHLVGDALLCRVADAMRKVAEGAFIARLGGDEFIMLISDGVTPESAGDVGERLLHAIGSEFEIDGHKIRVGLSVGIAMFPDDGEDATVLIAHADAALYRAKADGRGVVRYFESGMDRKLRERRALTQDLKSALRNGEITVFYQPLSRADGKVIGFEALARWFHPSKGSVPPEVFIPLAEESGVILELGEWILRRACREAASWRKPLNVAVNLSAVQFRYGDLAALVHTILLESGLAASRLELEITESVLIDDMPRALSVLRRLKGLGVRISIDDFGTGYSSLSNLQAFPFDKVKIDRSFITNLKKAPKAAIITRAVIGLAHGLGIPVIAEGVENAEQMKFLIEESCNEVQGYAIGEPAPIQHYDGLTGRRRLSASRPRPPVAPVARLK
jgi:diguanylate cyclase (GGDEF)-like protein/PAS domain S-box-containing protein